jgi:ribosomal protein S18 acetylase RimI-like enzyme
MNRPFRGRTKPLAVPASKSVKPEAEAIVPASSSSKGKKPSASAPAEPSSVSLASKDDAAIHVRRIHRRDLQRTWEFLKLCFRDVNRETVEYQRPRSKKRFFEVYEEEGVVQLLFELHHGKTHTIVGYAECALEISGNDNWMNHRYFTKRDMKPLFVEEIAVHPGHQGLGIGSFVLEQMEHLAKLNGCTHLVLEVAENNENALRFYRARSFQKLDAAIFLAKRLAVAPEILPPRKVSRKARPSGPELLPKKSAVVKSLGTSPAKAKAVGRKDRP